MKTKNLIAVIAAALLSSCMPQKEVAGDVSFLREDFQTTKELSNPQEIAIDSLLNPAGFRVMNDSVLVVVNQPNCEFLLELYSLNTLQPLAQLITKGNGPGEMFSCALGLHSNASDNFYLQDPNSKTCYIVDLKTLLNSRKFVPDEQFRYSSEVLPTSDLCLLDDNRYIGYHMWYLDDKQFSKVDSPLGYYQKGEDSGKGMDDFPFFVASVNGARLFKNPQTQELWTADMHRDAIRIYNDSLKQIRELVGPDHFSPEYTRRQIDAPVAFVTFADECDYHAYTDYYITDKHIYLVYEGNKHFDMKNLSPVEIFKLDFDGNLLCNYKLDRYVYSISINKKEDTLYCASRPSVMEPPVILKYKL